MSKRNTEDRKLTRKQIAVSRKEKEQLRWIYLGLGILAVIVIVILGIGLFQTYVMEPNSPVATVNGQDITTANYQDRVKYERFMLEQSMYQVQAQREQLIQTGDEQLAEMLVGQYDQQLQQLQQQRLLVDTNAFDQMVEDTLVAEEAAKRGITVTEDEVTEEANRFLARQLGGLTQAAASETEVARVDASATAALWTSTPTFTPSPTLTATGEITPTAIPLDTPTPAPTPTLNVISGGDLETQNTNWNTILSEQVGVDEAQYRNIARSNLLRTKVQEALSAEVSQMAEQANARHILVETEEESNDILQRLEDGEDFAELAAELSLDPGSGSSGGELGFVPAGRFVEAFDEAVFTTPIGQITVVETQFGWHIIEVMEREERELSPGDYYYTQQQAYIDWLDEARLAATVDDYWSPEKAPEDPLYSGQQ